jgi:hypothetical protein
MEVNRLYGIKGYFGMKGISRTDSNYTGWLVRIYRNNKTISRFFGDGKFGGREGSLLVARNYYWQIQQEHPAEPQKPFREKTLRNNKSGYNGICETFTRNRKGEPIPCWSVTWASPPNKPHCKSFYFHDEQERKQALKEAIEFRKQREAEILKSQRKKFPVQKD